MQYKFFSLLLFILLIFSDSLHSKTIPGINNDSFTQSEDTIEVYIIDAFVPPENPTVFNVSFYTSDFCKSFIKIDDKFEIPISTLPTDNHRAEIDFAKYKISKETIPYVIIVEDSIGTKFTTESYDIFIHNVSEVESESGNFFTCLTGGIVFLIPSVCYLNAHGEEFFRLKKELPLFTFYSGGFNYPIGAFMFGYAHSPKFNPKNIFLYSYKHIIEVPYIEYISPSVGGYSNFKGINGASTEFSIGLIKLYNVFTIEAGCKYNFIPTKKGTEFWELSIGLFSSFFSLHL